jgi:hypothetical protein
VVVVIEGNIFDLKEEAEFENSPLKGVCAG